VIVAWEARGKGQHRFYYRSRRVNGRVTKVYLGAGDVARQAAEKDAAMKAKQATDRTELAEFEAKLAGVDQLAAEVGAGIGLLLEGTLLAMGFRDHKGEWRRSRG
jgi:hypothetical protein